MNTCIQYSVGKATAATVQNGSDFNMGKTY